MPTSRRWSGRFWNPNSASRTASTSTSRSARRLTTKAKPKPAFTLKEAYDEGLIRIDAEVDPSSKNGERAHLRITAKEDAPLPLTVTVPKGRTSLHVDIPIDDFIVDATTAQTLTLTADKDAEIDVKQAGEQRVMKGTFQITTFEGAPIFTGSVTTGWVK